MARIRYGFGTDVGVVRLENQDSLGMHPDSSPDPESPTGALWIVADGMGGHHGGRHASELAVSTILSSYASTGASSIPDLLLSAMQKANALVLEEGTTIQAYRGMGTTCTALVLHRSSGWIAHIGDSRAYLVTPQEIRQLTADHSRVWDLYLRGVISREEARVHPGRNQLTRALGREEPAAVDLIGPIPLQAGSWLVMCTDGLTNHLEDEEIRQIVVSATPQDAAKALIALANKRGGTDNITVQIIEICAV